MMQSFNQRVCRMEETRVCKNTICSHDMNRGGAGGGGGVRWNKWYYLMMMIFPPDILNSFPPEPFGYQNIWGGIPPEPF